MATVAVISHTDPWSHERNGSVPNNNSVSTGSVSIQVPQVSESSGQRLKQYFEASFYREQEHLLDLSTIDTPNRLLALALADLKPVNESYATTDYEEALNWPVIMESLSELAQREAFRWTKQDFYVVEFRSTLKADIDQPLLFALDRESHREATASGGLLKYWYGSPDEKRRNLATCLWRSKEDAIAGGKGPWHRKARGVIARMYETINVQGLRLTIEDDVKGWSFERLACH